VLQLDFSIVNVALATIQRELGVAPADLQWVVTGYALPFGALLLLGGRLGDMAGHRRQLVSGLALFGLTSLGAGLAPSAGALIAFRFLQGASAALVAPMALATVTDLFEDGPARNRALGIFQGATAAGATAGGDRVRRDLDPVRRLAGGLPGQPAGHRGPRRRDAAAAPARRPRR
jgi:MFS family permease